MANPYQQYQPATAQPPPRPASTTTTAAPSTAPEPNWVKGLREAFSTQAYDQGTANKYAASQAKAQTATQLAAYHNAQVQELAAAQGRATQIGNLGKTVADYLGTIYNPAGVAQDYGNAIAGQQALGTGYANQFQANADQAAALAQQQIAASGGQGSVGNQAGSLASALTGLSVNLPANALGIQQLAAVEAAKAAPGLALGYAQQEATGALGAGQDAAAKYRPDITAAIAGEPALASKYLADYISQATAAHQDQVGNAFKLAGLSQSADAASALANYRNRPDVHFGPNGSVYSTDPVTGKVTQLQGPSQVPQVHGSPYSGLYSVDPATGKVTVLTQPVATIQPVFRSTAGGGTVAIDPTTGQVLGQVTPDKPVQPRTGVIADGTGQWLTNLDTGQKIRKVGGVKISAPSTSAPTTKKINGVTYQWDAGRKGWVRSTLPRDTTKKVGKLSSSQLQHLRSGIANAFFGVPEQKDASGNVTRAALPQATYQEAIQEGMQAGYSQADATRMANRFYKPGVRGRPGPVKWTNPNSFFANPPAATAAGIG